MNGDVADDFTTQYNSVVTTSLEFGNTWKNLGSVCSDTINETLPCNANPYCKPWAERSCNLIKGDVFQECHKKVDPTPYYDACVQESCVCNMKGKYLGFCTAVAVYAEECSKAGVCTRWRTSEICPTSCDFYNKPDECTWHYEPCGRQLTCQEDGITSVMEGSFSTLAISSAPLIVIILTTALIITETVPTTTPTITTETKVTSSLTTGFSISEKSKFTTSTETTTSATTFTEITSTKATTPATATKSTTTTETTTATTPTTVTETSTEATTTTTESTTTTETTTTPTTTTVFTTTTETTTAPTTTTESTTTTETTTTPSTTTVFTTTTETTTAPTTTTDSTTTTETTTPTTTTVFTTTTETTTAPTTTTESTTTTETTTAPSTTTVFTTTTETTTAPTTTTESTTTTETTTTPTTTTEFSTTTETTTTPTTTTESTTTTETTTAPTTTTESTTTTETATTPTTTTKSTTTTETTTATTPTTVTETSTEATTTTTESTTTTGTTTTPTTTTVFTTTTETTTAPTTTTEYTTTTETTTAPSTTTVFTTTTETTTAPTTTTESTASTETTTPTTTTEFTTTTETTTTPTTTTESTTTTETTTAPTTTTESTTTTETTTAPSTTTVFTTTTETTTAPTTTTESTATTETTTTPTTTTEFTTTTETTTTPTTTTESTTTTETTTTPTTTTESTTTTETTTTPTTTTESTATTEITTSTKTTTPSTTTESTTTTKTTKTKTPITVTETTSTETTAPTTTTEIMTTSKKTPDCYCDGDVTKRPNDTWKEDCYSLTCTAACKTERTLGSCPVQSKPKCKIQKKISDGCCPKYECFCQCKVYGGGHYETFTGVNYDFSENCTYTLIEETDPQYNFSVMVDNRDVDIKNPGHSSPKQIVIFYKQNSVTISSSNKYVYFNDHAVIPPHSENGISIISNGMTITVSISSINTSIIAYESESYEILIPQSLFQGRTRGQCGVCGGETGCARKNGKLESESCCSATAYDWIFDDPNKPYCKKGEPRKCILISNPPSPTLPSSKTASQDCTCSLLDNKLFDECRAKADLQQYKTKCLHDTDVKGDKKAGCAALQMAVAECAKFDYCIEWRNHTCGICDYSCPGDLVYDPCRDSTDDFCSGRDVHPGQTLTYHSEGCFCPPGKVKMSEHLEQCVKKCPSCHGPIGEPKYPGDTWISNCHNCTCNEFTKSEECKPVSCPQMQPCKANEKLKTASSSDTCCPTAACVEKTCQYHQHEYKEGELVQDDKHPCISYTCQDGEMVSSVQECQNQTHCPEDNRTYDANKCCYTCNTKCYPAPYTITLQKNNCSAVISLTKCDGNCNDIWYDANTESVISVCKCCEPKTSEKRNANLICRDGTKLKVGYDYVTSCNCNSCSSHS
ncbi:mucin-2-like [Protopterus annectens]|uniref:mucin-2-like n=1 Tax=Protopterus annectens TaxID=7888 RepID=UPI001CFA5276|nr:mucin-2-like [Protopterus annectens]